MGIVGQKGAMMRNNEWPTEVKPAVPESTGANLEKPLIVPHEMLIPQKEDPTPEKLFQEESPTVAVKKDDKSNN